MHAYAIYGRASATSCNLTTVDQPKEAMANAAVEMLVARMADRSKPLETRRFSPNLVVRASTDDRPPRQPA